MAFVLRRILELARDRRGTIMPAVTISAIVFVTMGGLVVDGGRLFWNKRTLQGAADAAALGGAFELKRGNRNLGSQIRPAAVNDAGLNGADESNSTITVDTFSCENDVRDSRFAIVEIASSIGSVISVSTSSGPAPG